MSLTLYISSNCKSPIICDFEFFLRVRSQTQVFVVFQVFAVKGCREPGREPTQPGTQPGKSTRTPTTGHASTFIFHFSFSFFIFTFSLTGHKIQHIEFRPVIKHVVIKEKKALFFCKKVKF